tara:strand:- start:29934 stop:30764 length:831 start_codon:yes stop_codon:yes gene_type:complete
MNYGFTNFYRKPRFASKRIDKLIKFFEIQKRINWKKYIQKTYVIHLPTRQDRLAKIKKRAKAQKLSSGYTLLNFISFFEGINGKMIKSFNKKIHTDQYNFDYHWSIDPTPWMKHRLENNQTVQCSPAETGIAFSHYRIWKEIVENKTPVSLIMEDDFEFCYNFQGKIESIFENELPKKWDLLYLSSLPGHTGFTWDPQSDNLIRLYNGVWWLSGYVLTYEGAKTLLNNLPIVGPVDVWINHQFKDLDVYMSKENLIEQADDTKSDNTYSFIETFGH